ncbi:MAG: glycosyltransferase [Steroidobacteraceae bacterium]
MLRVLHVISSVSPLRGGPSVAMHNVMEALRRRGIRVDVVTTDDDGANRRRDVPLDRFVDHCGQRLRYFPRQFARYCASYPMLRWLGRHVGDYDLVHTHGLFSFAPLAAAWHARLAGVPYVMRPAGVLDTWGMTNKSVLIKRTSIRMVEAPLLRAAAAVHFMTELERSRAARLALAMRPVVLPLGFDFGSGAAPAASVADELQAGDRPVILYLSRIHEIKCVDMLLRAFASLPARDRAVLAIAGDGATDLVSGLKRLADELGVGSSVRWLGFAQGARKSALFGRATLFVLPSASENFGIAIAEAMHARLPVIVTQGAGLAELVRTSGAGIVTDGSLDGLRTALAQLLSDASLRHAMGEAGAVAVERELSLEACGARLEALYASLLSAARVKGPATTPGVCS